MRTVSVIIPTFNRPLLLRRALDSVLHQTYRDLEVIIVDEGSSEAVHRNNLHSCLSDNRVRYLYRKKSRGVAAARNDGIRMAKGDYVAFLDDDDIWLPEKIEKQNQFMLSNENVSVVCCDCRRIGSNGRGKALATNAIRIGGKLRRGLFTRCSVQEPWYRVKREALYSILLLSHVFHLTSSGMVERECLLKIGLFDETLPTCEDWDLTRRLARCYNFGYIDDVLVRVRGFDSQYGESRLMNDADLMLVGHLRSFDKIEREAPEIIRRYSNSRIVERYLPTVLHFVDRGQFTAADSILDRVARKEGQVAARSLMLKLCFHTIILNLSQGDIQAVEPLIDLLAQAYGPQALIQLIIRLAISSPLTAIESFAQPASGGGRKGAVRLALRRSAKMAFRYRRSSCWKYC